MRFTSLLFPVAIFSLCGSAIRHARETREDADDWCGAQHKSPPDDQGGYSAVSGTWGIPVKVNPDDTLASAVSVWVGLDGYTDTDTYPQVVQAGLDAILDEEGEVTYKVWAEWFPDDSHYIDEGDFSVLPGDTMTVNIQAYPGSTTAEIEFSNSAGDSFTYNLAPSSPDYAVRGVNMEWMVERIHGNAATGPTGQLMGFGDIEISNCFGSTVAAAQSVNLDGAIEVDMLNGDSLTACIATIRDTGTVEMSWITH